MENNKFGILRKILKTLGLSQESTEETINFIHERISGDRKNGDGADARPPYLLRDHFLSPAELSFYEVLKTAVAGQGTLCTKVNLNDLFYVKSDDFGQYRSYTNKIDRKHVDFVVCDCKTMQPLVGIELDDKSHQRKDRQERDAFVNTVFEAANLPLLHLPVQRAYKVAELKSHLTPYLEPAQETQAPACSKCGKPMLLRVAKKGANAGNEFWGCPDYPACRSMLRKV